MDEYTGEGVRNRAESRVTAETYDLAFGAVVLLEHLHVRILGQAGLADRGEVRRLPAGAVKVFLHLGRHDERGSDECGKRELVMINYRSQT